MSLFPQYNSIRFTSLASPRRLHAFQRNAKNSSQQLAATGLGQVRMFRVCMFWRTYDE